MDDTHDADSSSTPSRRQVLAGLGAAAGAVAVPTVAMAQSDRQARRFRVVVENVSDGDTLQTTAEGEAADQPVPLSPGAYAVHAPDEPIFTPGEPERGNGLEEIAEDGKPPGKLAGNLAARDSVTDAGAFAVPSGKDSPGPLLPGHSYEFEVTAHPGKPTRSLSLVTMFVPSNDLFFALGGSDGLALFDGAPRRGNVTDAVGLWDAGTEVNQEPGVGDNQVQRQRGVGVGDVERGTVVPIEEVNGYDYPAVEDVIRVSVTPQGN